MESIVRDAAGYQRSQLAKMICLMALPTVTLVIIAMIVMTTSLKTTNSTQALNDRISTMVKLARLLAAVQVERGVSTVYVVAVRPAIYVDSLAEARGKVQQRLNDVGNNFRVTLNGQLFTTTGPALEYLVMFRAMVDERRTTLSDTIYFYTNITTALMTAMFQNTQIDDIGGVWTKFTAYMFLLRAVDKLGVQRALGASYFATCYISTANRFWVRTLQSNSDGFIELAMVHYPVLTTTHESKLADLDPVIRHLSRSLGDVLDPNTTTHCRELADDERVDVAMDFFKDMTSYIAHYQETGTSVLTDIVDNVETATRDATVNVIIYAIIAACVLLLSAALIAWYVRKIRGMIAQIRTYATSTAEKMSEVKGNASSSPSPSSSSSSSLCSRSVSGCCF